MNFCKTCQSSLDSMLLKILRCLLFFPLLPFHQCTIWLHDHKLILLHYCRVTTKILSRTISSKNNTKKLKPLHWLRLSRAVEGSLWAKTQNLAKLLSNVDWLWCFISNEKSSFYYSSVLHASFYYLNVGPQRLIC